MVFPANTLTLYHIKFYRFRTGVLVFQYEESVFL
jgi:hypothetical protein